jgi:hypothetical protein
MGLISRERGTPQGGVVSPLLANLFLHYAFDRWLRRNHPGIPFERYADDAICHWRSGDQAKALRASLEKRFAECGLTLHPEKTKIVYCKDDDRRGDYPNQKFDFLGYTFRPRLSRRWRGTFGVVFSPAASDKALKTIRQTVRRWTLHERSDKSLDDLARMFHSHIRGWINYYGRYYKSALYPTLRHIDRILARWAHRKFKSLRRHRRQTAHWIARVARRHHRCSLTGGFCGVAAEQWEPDEARASRPVLRARGGATPLHDPPCGVVSQLAGSRRGLGGGAAMDGGSRPEPASDQDAGGQRRGRGL